MTIEEALRRLKDGDLYDRKGYVSSEGQEALDALEDVELTIKALEKRPVGKWIFHRDRYASGGAYYKCNLCKMKYSVGAYFEINEENYCPNCGAKMEV